MPDKPYTYKPYSGDPPVSSKTVLNDQGEWVRTDERPTWLVGARYPNRIEDNTKRDTQIKNIYQGLLDEYGDGDQARLVLKQLGNFYGTSRTDPNTEAYSNADYYGFDAADIDFTRLGIDGKPQPKLNTAGQSADSVQSIAKKRYEMANLHADGVQSDQTPSILPLNPSRKNPYTMANNTMTTEPVSLASIEEMTSMLHSDILLKASQKNRSSWPGDIYQYLEKRRFDDESVFNRNPYKMKGNW